MWRDLLLLTGVSLTLATAAGWVASFLHLGGAEPLLFALVATAVCLVPTLVTLAWSRVAGRHSPEDQFIAVVGGTALRMAWTLLAGLVLFGFVPPFSDGVFWVWLLFAYLTTLSLEMLIVTAVPAVMNRPGPPNSPGS